MEVTKKRRLSPEDNHAAVNGAAINDTDLTDSANGKTKDQKRTLFVRSLPVSVTNDRLTEIFSQSYPIKHATVVQDPATKTSKGYGFVTFADPEDAQQALTEFNESTVEGRKIKVEVAQPRHRDLAGEGGKSVPSAKSLDQKAERANQKADTLPPKLIIRNLPWSIKEPEDLANLFRSYGKVKSAVIPKKGPRAQSGFGFVVIRGRKNAEKALEGVNGTEVDGRTLAVDWAVDKKTWQEIQKNEEQTGTTAEGEAQVDRVSADESEVESSDAEQGAETVELDEDEIDEDLDKDILNHLDEEAEENVSEDEDVNNEENSSTVFIRNLPFTATDDTLYEHFTPFGPVRYARVVMDMDTERSRGTGFVCFYNEDSARDCVKNAPRSSSSLEKPDKKNTKSQSILQNEASDPSGKYTMEGRILQVTRALSKESASRKEAEGTDRRNTRDRDKRRLYLLSEGTIPAGSALYKTLGPTELNIRAASAKQRQNLIKSNPSLHLSLTRLSIRNIPRSVTSKDLKQLAREAVVGFATDVKAGLREPLSKEELSRGAEDMKEAEKQRKLHGKGIVKQAKIVFEGREGGKVNEKSGVGRSRGYGFIEYATHRSALMGLRWLNGHAVRSSGAAGKEERQKRLIVEFAIENAQVVARRKELEDKSRNGELGQGKFAGPKNKTREKGRDENRKPVQDRMKRKRSGSEASGATQLPAKRAKKIHSANEKESKADQGAGEVGEERNKIAKRNRIISKKRQMRKTRRTGK